jgi:uncharacterized protein YdaU (DUF1376 family)
MQFFVADYLADTMHLSTEEHGAYLLLIFNYWQTGKPLPNDDRRLSIIARLNNERWADVKQTLIEFFVVSNGVLKHPRIEADLKFIEEKQQKAVAAGKASALARAERKKNKDNARSTDVTTDVAETLQPNGNHIDSESDSESLTTSPPLAAGFDAFWKAYPTKKNKKKALEIWKRKKLHTQSAKLIADILNRKEKDRAWNEGFIPHPTTYLNGERWEDEIEPIKGGNGSDRKCFKCMSYIGCNESRDGQPPKDKKCFYPSNVQ